MEESRAASGRAAPRQPVDAKPNQQPIVGGEEIFVKSNIGGFQADVPSTGEIDIKWANEPSATAYLILRSEHKRMKLVGSTDIQAQQQSNNYIDNRVRPNTHYYYAIIAAMKDGTMHLVATGSASTPFMDGPLRSNQP